MAAAAQISDLSTEYTTFSHFVFLTDETNKVWCWEADFVRDLLFAKLSNPASYLPDTLVNSK